MVGRTVCRDMETWNNSDVCMMHVGRHCAGYPVRDPKDQRSKANRAVDLSRRSICDLVTPNPSSKRKNTSSSESLPRLSAAHCLRPGQGSTGAPGPANIRGGANEREKQGSSKRYVE